MKRERAVGLGAENEQPAAREPAKKTSRSRAAKVTAAQQQAGSSEARTAAPGKPRRGALPLVSSGRCVVPGVPASAPPSAVATDISNAAPGPAPPPAPTSLATTRAGAAANGGPCLRGPAASIGSHHPTSAANRLHRSDTAAPPAPAAAPAPGPAPEHLEDGSDDDVIVCSPPPAPAQLRHARAVAQPAPAGHARAPSPPAPDAVPVPLPVHVPVPLPTPCGEEHKGLGLGQGSAARSGRPWGSRVPDGRGVTQATAPPLASSGPSGGTPAPRTERGVAGGAGAEAAGHKVQSQQGLGQGGSSPSGLEAVGAGPPVPGADPDQPTPMDMTPVRGAPWGLHARASMSAPSPAGGTPGGAACPMDMTPAPRPGPSPVVAATPASACTQRAAPHPAELAPSQLQWRVGAVAAAAAAAAEAVLEPAGAGFQTPLCTRAQVAAGLRSGRGLSVDGDSPTGAAAGCDAVRRDEEDGAEAMVCDTPPPPPPQLQLPGYVEASGLCGGAEGGGGCALASSQPMPSPDPDACAALCREAGMAAPGAGGWRSDAVAGSAAGASGGPRSIERMQPRGCATALAAPVAAAAPSAAPPSAAAAAPAAATGASVAGSVAATVAPTGAESRSPRAAAGRPAVPGAALAPPPGGHRDLDPDPSAAGPLPCMRLPPPPPDWDEPPDGGAEAGECGGGWGEDDLDVDLDREDLDLDLTQEELGLRPARSAAAACPGPASVSGRPPAAAAGAAAPQSTAAVAAAISAAPEQDPDPDAWMYTQGQGQGQRSAVGPGRGWMHAGSAALAGMDEEDDGDDDEEEAVLEPTAALPRARGLSQPGPRQHAVPPGAAARAQPSTGPSQRRATQPTASQAVSVWALFPGLHPVKPPPLPAQPSAPPPPPVVSESEPAPEAQAWAQAAAAPQLRSPAVRSAGAVGGGQAAAAVAAELGLGEECSPEYWAPSPEVYEVFPFQRNALEFADWANAVAPRDLAAMQAAAAAVNFASFADRWQFVAEWMAAHPPPPPPEQADEEAEDGAGEQAALADGGCPAADARAEAQQCAASARGRGAEWVRVFVQEYRRGGGARAQAGSAPAAAAAAIAPAAEGADYSRHFVVTSYKGVWRRYQWLAATQRHFYEVIRGPCHLYFDIEFSRGANPGADGDALVDAVVERLAGLLRAAWGVELSASRREVLELESVMEGAAGAPGAAAPADKFSRHLLVRLPGGRALASNGVAGAILARLAPELQADGLCLLKAGEPPGGATSPMVDPAVYSRCRHFRMLWSCKGGKRAVLRPTNRYMLAPGACASGGQALGGVAGAMGGGTGGLGAQRLWLASLICNVGPGARLLHVPPGFLGGVPLLWPALSFAFTTFATGGVAPMRPGGPAPATGAWAGGAGAAHGGGGGGGGGLGVPTVCVFDGTITHATTQRPIKLTWSAEPTELRPSATHTEAGAGGGGAAAQSAGGGAVAGRPPGSRPTHAGGRTPLQALALAAVEFVEAMARDRAGGAEAQVRSMAYCGEAASVSFGMIGPGSHYCDRIGRRHRSNHCYFLLDFLRGRYCQKCYDPDCAGWRSEWTAMPLETWTRPAPATPPAPTSSGHSGSSSSGAGAGPGGASAGPVPVLVLDVPAPPQAPAAQAASGGRPAEAGASVDCRAASGGGPGGGGGEARVPPGGRAQHRGGAIAETERDTASSSGSGGGGWAAQALPPPASHPQDSVSAGAWLDTGRGGGGGLPAAARHAPVNNMPPPQAHPRVHSALPAPVPVAALFPGLQWPAPGR
ncbi:hypothetical protein HYH03_014209 [Edaphochlamys debaryana]|uniref:DNA-directed primase/polymerase protein n=1 Tax=Edaphochlamys debaryana TaxID=47281 RepID=A0A835XNE9_9CHLO|nr:hypothetical protein HYH03_014209 [Edaphochlamys debaryana]|eukprot:KAG2487096.1 hypothetical protein HYH03_014209 [Edaphochlamys debaryana]